MFDLTFTRNVVDRCHFSCRRWREVRKSERLYRKLGYTLTRCARTQRRPGYWKHDRTLSRIAARAMRELA